MARDKQRQRYQRRVAAERKANGHNRVGEMTLNDGVRLDDPESQARLDKLVDKFISALEEGDEIDPELTERFRDWLATLASGRASSLAKSLSVEDQMVAMPLLQIATSYSAWARLGPKTHAYFTDLLAEVGLRPPKAPPDLLAFEQAVARGDPDALAKNDEINASWKDWLVAQIHARKTAAEVEARGRRITRQEAQRALRRADPTWDRIQRQTWETLWLLVDNPDRFNRLSDASKDAVAEILSAAGFVADENPQLARLSNAISQKMTFDEETTRQHTAQGHPQSWISQGRTMNELSTLSESLGIMAAEHENFVRLGGLMTEHPEFSDERLAQLYNETWPDAHVGPEAIKYVRDRYGSDGLPGVRLPDGMKVGDPIYGNDKLIGHVNERGDFIKLVTPEHEEFNVPVVLDGPWAKELLAEADITPDKEVSIRIGGPSPKKATPVEYMRPERQPDEKLFHDRDETRHMLATASLGQFTVSTSGRLSFNVMVDGETTTLETRDPEIVSTLVADRDAGKTLAESICQLAERLSDEGAERFFTYRVDGLDPVSRAIAEVTGDQPVSAPRAVSLMQLAVAVAKAKYDETYQKNEREIGKLAAEWTDAGGTLEDFSKALADEPNGRPISTRQLELLKQEYLLSGAGIREAVGGPVPAGACDFCDGSAPAAWIYPAENFAMQTPDGLPWQSQGAWAACAQCANLIERDDRVALANRYLATKPKAFHDVLRPWTIRLHNQFVRRRTGERIRYERPELPQGEITVMTAEQADEMGMHDMAARVRASGDVMMSIEDPETGERTVIAEGTRQVDMRLERRTLAGGYDNHPLINRLRQHIKQAEAATGMWHSTEPWQVLAEKYSMTMSAAASLGLPDMQGVQGGMYFDPMLLRAGLGASPEYADELGLSIARSLHDAVPYLWLQKIDELADEGDLPDHTITRDLLPDSVMYWSFEDALGEPTARIDWMLIRATPIGYEVWCPQADDVNRPGSIMITGMLLGYGKRWPDDFKGASGDLAEWMLKRLSFINSKYVDVPKVVAARHVRRDVERQMKPGMVKPPDDLAAYVVHLRERVQPLVVGGEPGSAPGREYKHHWWRRPHRRVLYRDTPKERVTWVKGHRVGDPNLPPIKNKVKVVSR